MITSYFNILLRLVPFPRNFPAWMGRNGKGLIPSALAGSTFLTYWNQSSSIRRLIRRGHTWTYIPQIVPAQALPGSLSLKTLQLAAS